jgi:hypothetical protein
MLDADQKLCELHYTKYSNTHYRGKATKRQMKYSKLTEHCPKGLTMEQLMLK